MSTTLGAIESMVVESLCAIHKENKCYDTQHTMEQLLHEHTQHAQCKPNKFPRYLMDVMTTLKKTFKDTTNNTCITTYCGKLFTFTILTYQFSNFS